MFSKEVRVMEVMLAFFAQGIQKYLSINNIIYLLLKSKAPVMGAVFLSHHRGLYK